AVERGRAGVSADGAAEASQAHRGGQGEEGRVAIRPHSVRPRASARKRGPQVKHSNLSKPGSLLLRRVVRGMIHYVAVQAPDANRFFLVVEIKQHLRIRKFLGRDKNAIRGQSSAP